VYEVGWSILPHHRNETEREVILMTTMANEMRDRLYDLLGECEKKYYAYYEEFIKRLDKAETQAEFEKIYDGIIKKHDFFADHLIENGVIVPPCSLHQTLWEITWNKRIEQCKVSSFTQKADGSFKIRISPKCSGVYEITPDKIGEKIFLTKDQAEQKLKEVRGG
jgi:hypothetical protein